MEVTLGAEEVMVVHVVTVVVEQGIREEMQEQAAEMMLSGEPEATASKGLM